MKSLFVVCFVLLACSSPPISEPEIGVLSYSYPLDESCWQIDQKLTESQKDLVRVAMAEWNTATDSVLISECDMGHQIKAHDNRHPTHRYTVASTTYEDIDLYLPTLEEYPAKTIIMAMTHELGHIYASAEHIPGTLMAVHAWKPDYDNHCIDEITLDLACQKNECGENAGSTCE